MQAITVIPVLWTSRIEISANRTLLTSARRV